jgi:acetyl esterase/lipase
MEFIKPKWYNDADSMWDLQTEAFDLDNTPQGSFRKNENFLITPDVPKGVLGGMVAAPSGDWESTNGLHTLVPLGLYNKNSEGAPYTNNSAIGSGKVAIYMHGGTFLLYLFETNAPGTGATAAKVFSTNYAPGVLLYCSEYSLLTDDKPSSVDPVNGKDFVIAVVSATPTTVTQEMGIKLTV